ncbi:hypothetical protein MOP88_12005 [Sphingomonas sp. WKB10]|nr:hypothetical protein [Sphingomonas sp. WKB10]
MTRSATLLLAAAAVASITVGATARDTAPAPGSSGSPPSTARCRPA